MESQYQKIKSPKTGNMIYMYGKTYQSLINKHGYTEKELSSLPKYGTNKPPRSPKYTLIKKNEPNPLILKDALYNILLHSDLNTIKNICETDKQANKICNDKYFWKNKITYDNLLIVEDMPFTMKSYKKAQDIIKKVYILIN